MLAGVTIVDPQTTWIEPDVELEPDATVHPFTVLRGRTRVAAGRRDRPARRRRRRRRSGQVRSSAPSVTFAPARSSRRGRRRAPSWRSRTRTIGRVRRCRISRTSATPRSARTRTSARATSPRTSRIEPGQPKGRTTIGRNVRTGIHNGFVAPVEVGDDAWIAAGSVITKDVPAGRARRRPLTPGQQGRVCRLEMETTELAPLPGLERDADRTCAAAGPLDRARAAEAADGLLRPVAPGAGAADRRAARHRARRGRARDVRERRDVLPLRRVDPRRRRLPRPDRLPPGRRAPDGAASS